MTLEGTGRLQVLLHIPGKERGRRAAPKENPWLGVTAGDLGVGFFK